MSESWRLVVRDPRMAGDVERFHAWPTLRRQTVAHHCWNAARILLAIWPDAPKYLLVEVLFHDNGELGAGDTPGHVKADHPKLSAMLDVVETGARLVQCVPWGLPPATPLAEWERKALKLCDTWELWEEALFEMTLGNRHSEHVVRRSEPRLVEMIELIGDPTARARADEMFSRRKREWGV